MWGSVPNYAYSQRPFQRNSTEDLQVRLCSRVFTKARVCAIGQMQKNKRYPRMVKIVTEKMKSFETSVCKSWKEQRSVSGLKCHYILSWRSCPRLFGRFYFVFRPKQNTGQLFRWFREVFRRFPPREKFFDGTICFCKFSWDRRDSIGPKIVEIGAILAIFRPFEVSKKLSWFRVI